MAATGLEPSTRRQRGTKGAAAGAKGRAARNDDGERTRPAATPSAEPANVAGLESTDDSLRRSFLWWGRAAFALAAVFLAIQLLGVARQIFSVLLVSLLLFVFATVLALICEPAVKLLSTRLPRTLSVLICLGFVVAAVAGLVAMVSSPLISEGRAVLGDLPRLQRPLDAITGWLADRGLGVGTIDLHSLVNQSFGNSGSGLTSFVIAAVSSTFSVIIDIAVVLVTSFWLLRDSRALKRSVIANTPAAWQPHVEFVVDATAIVVGGYVRAQAGMALLVGTLGGLGCFLLGVPYPLVVAVATGVFELIPLVGAIAGAAVGALLALTVSPLLVAETLVLFLFIHVVEGYLIAPRVQARFVRIHPLVAFLALFAGVEIGGFLGALFAVPIASLVALLLRAVLGDVKANRPELFDPKAVRADAEVAGRRHRLLREYRVFNVHPIRRLRRRLQR